MFAVYEFPGVDVAYVIQIDFLGRLGDQYVILIVMFRVLRHVLCDDKKFCFPETYRNIYNNHRSHNYDNTTIIMQNIFHKSKKKKECRKIKFYLLLLILAFINSKTILQTWIDKYFAKETKNKR